jgi:hypothetical protein
VTVLCEQGLRGSAVHDGECTDHDTRLDGDRTQGAEGISGHEDGETTDLNVSLGMEQADAVELGCGQFRGHGQGH